MNYLAHLYLSNDQPLVQLGNLMGDYVKGRLENSSYSGEILQGLKLHRLIDSYTDQHPVTERSRQYFAPEHRRYSKIMLDIFYDHFLAKNWLVYHQQPLVEFAQNIYELLENSSNLLAPQFYLVKEYMIADDWINSYQDLEGIADALARAAYRLPAKYNIEESVSELENNYAELENDFKDFFPTIIDYVKAALTS